MSQAGSILFSGGGGGTLTTLTGNTGGAVSPSLGNINVVGDGVTINVVGNPGTSTLTISSTDQSFAQVTTADATLTTLKSFTLSANSSVTMELQITVADDIYSQGAAAHILVGARRAGAGAILIGTPVIDRADDFGGVIGFSATTSGNNLLVRVTGIAATNITWKAIVTTVVLP